MQSLRLTANKLQGELSNSFGNMPDCFLDSLQYLNLDFNQLFGHIIDEFGEFKNLKELSLGSNLLSGAIPPNLGQLMSLEMLYLDDNKLSGNLPESLGQFFNLKYLLIGDNKLEGVVTESHFANLTKLAALGASYNHKLTLKVNPNWIPPFQLEDLYLSSLDLGTTNIPSWLDKQKNLSRLDLSNNGISGVVPNRFWRIRYLNLPNNHLHGKIPEKIGGITVYLSSDQFSGPLPLVGNSVIVLDLTNNSFSGGLSHFFCGNITNLEFLHLKGNQLTGELPDCFMKCPSLRRLYLGNNSLSGSIPNSIRFLTNLTTLNLYRNNFSGQIPVSLSSCTKLVTMDLHENNLDGNIPTRTGTSLSKLVILILRSNKLSGEISSDICLLNSLQILDLSDNNLFGTIPSCVNKFTAMVTKRDATERDMIEFYLSSDIFTSILERVTISTKGEERSYDTILPFVKYMNLSNNNLSGGIPKEMTSLVELRFLSLSGNQLTGLIPQNIGDMKQLESLDLSRNSVSGGIPDSLATITSLGYLKLSNNNLTGKIPQGPQISGFDPMSFMGNHLCGPQVKVNCDDGDQVPEPANNGNNQVSKSEIDWFYVFLSSGFATGFSVVCSTLISNKTWRDAYFVFVEDMWDKFYIFLYVKWRRLVGDDQLPKAASPLCLILLLILEL